MGRSENGGRLGRALVLEFVQALHAAFHTNSKWLFIFYIGLIGFLLFSLLGYVVQAGYERELRERAVLSIPPQTVVVKDAAEEDRLRAENAELKAQLDDRANRSRIQKQLGVYVDKGLALKNNWAKVLGQDENAQRPCAIAIEKWHKDVEGYLGTIPQGQTYLTRFRIQARSTGVFPVGINFNLSGAWERLDSDLSRLNEFITDPDLGKP